MLDNVSTASKPKHADNAPTPRRTVFRFLETAEDEDLASRIVDTALIVLIAASVLAVILESIPALEKAYGPQLYWFEVFTIAVFSVEYILRVWSCVEAQSDAGSNPFTHRLRFMFTFHAIIDLLAILPFYLLVFGIFGGVDMRFLRAVRLLRVLKLTRYFAALNMLLIAIKENSRALGASFLILVTIMLLASSGMYYFERQSQPVDFGSIPAAMWWAFATLTTVGYGDVTPITVGGKIFGALITVVAIGLVALPTSILASGYSQQLKLSTDAYRQKADEALDDGILSDEELRELESLRVDLGLGKHTASQILDKGAVRAALQGARKAARCPHCDELLEQNRS
ncbi:MAG: ion transporter [Gammaproteobacteria bacterium]|nr:ion transporter [Gammaproteobacteria bacterium]